MGLNVCFFSENAEEVSITADDVIKRFQNASSITAVIHGYLDRSNSGEFNLDKVEA